MRRLLNNSYLKFPLRFFAVYLPLHFMYLVVISASHPLGKLYSPFVIDYLNVINGLRNVLLTGITWLLRAFQYAPFYIGETGIRLPGGGQVNLNNACLGWGVMAFWIAFVFANSGTAKSKAKWMMIGIVSICLINIVRIAVLLVALNKKWNAFINIDQHTMFNIIGYALVFGLMYLFIKSSRKKEVLNVE